MNNAAKNFDIPVWASFSPNVIILMI